MKTTEEALKTKANPTVYCSYFGILREIAIKNGYSLSIHGSLQNDMNLIAVPWTKEAVEPEILITAFNDWISGTIDSKVEECVWGRKSFVITLRNGMYLDVAVFPKENIKVDNVSWKKVQEIATKQILKTKFQNKVEQLLKNYEITKQDDCVFEINFINDIQRLFLAEQDLLFKEILEISSINK